MTELLNIVKGVPIPPINRGSTKGARRVYPFETMEIGDWVFVEGRDTKSVSAYVSRATKDLLGCFVTRPGWGIKNDGKWTPAEAETPGAVEGTSVWRVEDDHYAVLAAKRAAAKAARAAKAPAKRKRVKKNGAAGNRQLPG